MFERDIAKGIRQALEGRSLVLVGLMGCGKSSVGRRLASRLALPFSDADDEAETAAGKAIKDIFAQEGEACFRELERRVIVRLLEKGPRVVATGGGAFMDNETRRNIACYGLSIWLKADLSTLMKRVSRRDTRPLLNTANPEEVMRRLMEVRYPVYGKADIVVESRDVSHERIVSEILVKLRNLLGLVRVSAPR